MVSQLNSSVLADEGDSDTLGSFNEIIVAVWRGWVVPQQWKDENDQGAAQEDKQDEVW